MVGVWFSGGCNLDQLIDSDGNLREATSYRASYEDTLLDVARRFNLGYVEMVAANPGTDPWIPGEGTDVVLPTVHLVPKAEPEGILINLADMRLYYFGEPGAEPRSYPIGIGRDGLMTPLGVTEIARKKKDPAWRPTARMRAEDPELPEVMPPGPDNPMGTRAMYLGWPLYAIHGTNNPWAVGRRSSSGCIRMYPEHAEELYELVEVGTKVTVVDQPVTRAHQPRFVLLELFGHVPFGPDKRLTALVVVRYETSVRTRNLQVVAEHAVVPDLQGLDAGAFAFVALPSPSAVPPASRVPSSMTTAPENSGLGVWN